ncbi:MAG: hypothetical protein Q8O40_14775 [Chloroflexota bacterium]|nr:hypothetical protein [Chloroflexota bacterium]
MVAELEVMNPVARLASELKGFSSPAPRPQTLRGLSVGLYWNRKPGGNFLLERTGELVLEKFPGTQVHFYNARRPIPKEVLEQIKSECNVVIGATAD